MMRSLLIVALFAALVQAQPDEVGKRTRVEGRVTNLKGEAMASAIVRLQGVPMQGEPVPTYSQSADDDGKFAFGDVDPGFYTLTADKAGYVTHQYGARSDDSPAAQITLTAGIEFKDLSLVMTPLGILYGRVTDQDGKAVAKAQINVYREGSDRQELMPVGMYDGRGISDDQGNYRVSYLPSGRYYVSAAPVRDTNVGGPAPANINVTTFYPNVPNATSAIPVEVKAGGEVRGVDIRLHRQRVYSIRGRVIDSTSGEPAAGMTLLEIKSIPGQPSSTVTSTLLGSAKTAPDGSFEMRSLMPGPHVLQVFSSTFIRISTDSSLEPPATGRLEVAITDSDVNNVMIQVTLGAAPPMNNVPPLQPGVSFYAVRVPLDLTPGLAGTVRNERGDPMPEASVMLWPKIPDKSGIRTTKTDRDGSFKISGLAPGEYFVAAWDDTGDTAVAQNLDLLARLSAYATAVKLEEGAHQRADIKFISGMR